MGVPQVKQVPEWLHPGRGFVGVVGEIKIEWIEAVDLDLVTYSYFRRQLGNAAIWLLGDNDNLVSLSHPAGNALSVGPGTTSGVWFV